MNNWKVIFATVIIFGAGVITGGLLVNYVHLSERHGGTHKTAAQPPPGTNVAVQASGTNPATATIRLSEVLNKSFLSKLDTALALTPEQHKCIDKIIAAGQEPMRKVMVDVSHNIREQLTPDQRKKYDDLLKPFRPTGPHHPSSATNQPSMLVPTNAPLVKTNLVSI